ncbi:hypothetical protein GCM10023145_25700 [Angustibacter luteus]
MTRVIRFLIRILVYFLSALIGIIVANLLLTDLTVDARDYILVAVIFALVQAILSPMMTNMVQKNASAFSGGVGIVSTLVALIVTVLISDGITIDGLTTWILAALIIWLAGAIAAFVLPFFLVKKAVGERRA